MIFKPISGYLHVDGLNELNSKLKLVPSKKLSTRHGRRKVLGKHLFYLRRKKLLD